MAQAVRTLSRRSLLVGVAAAVPAAAAAGLAKITVDPIFAALDQLKAAEIELTAACFENSDMEELLPPEVRRSEITAHKTNIVPTDDPRWIAAERRLRKAFVAVDECSLNLLDVRPTTIAGLSALLRFSYQYEVEDGRQWPDNLIPHDKPDSTLSVDFAVFLNLHAAQALDEMTAS